MARKKKVAYFYDTELGNYYYGPGHPMKPHRIRMTHNLVLHYGLHNMMEIYHPRPASYFDMINFHTEDYIKFLQKVTPENQDSFLSQTKLFQIGKDKDSPVFTGLFDYCRRYAGGSIGGAVKLNYASSDIVINWAGGLHHAKKAEASGFCYINDIVLAILELLKHHQRVLYVDLDVHHGDGVEEAFYTTDRVMTVSFHKYGDDFFPCTGDIYSVGEDRGTNYCVNVPLKDGMTDEAFFSLFKPIMSKVMQTFQPQAIVFQSGADSLSGDMLGVFNLTVKGHAACLQFMQSFQLPMLLLGGGGYTVSNVARCWTYETGRILGVELSDNLPPNEYQEYYSPDHKLHWAASSMENLNSHAQLEILRNKILQNLSKLPHAPSIDYHTRPDDALSLEEIEDSLHQLSSNQHILYEDNCSLKHVENQSTLIEY